MALRSEEIIEGIYQTATGQAEVGQLLGRIAHSLDIDKGSFFAYQDKVMTPYRVDPMGLDPKALDQYQNEFADHNIWASNAMANPHVFAGMYVGRENIPKAEYEHSIWYNEFLLPQDIDDVYSLNTPHMVDGVIHVLSMSLFSPADLKALPANSREWLQSLLPHIQNALRMRLVLDEKNLEVAFYQQSLTVGQPACVLVNEQGRVLQRSAAAEALFESEEGIFCLRGNLLVRDAKAQKQLEQVYYQSQFHWRGAAPAAVPPVVLPRVGKAPCLIQAYPMPQDPGSLLSNKGYTLVVFNDLQQPKPTYNMQAAQVAFGLTEKETEIVAGLIQGLDLKEICQHSSFSVATARNYLKSIFKKTQTSRQAELVAVLLRCF